VKPIVRIHPEAKEELRQARDYYRHIDPGLAKRLLTEHNVALKYIRDFPHAGAPLFGVYRHVVLPHFPYMIVYSFIDSVVNVLTVVHLKRDPEHTKRVLEQRIP